MKLIIEIDVDASDFEEMEATEFVTEAEQASGLNIEVGRQIDENHGSCRMYSLSTSYFKVRTE